MAMAIFLTLWGVLSMLVGFALGHVMGRPAPINLVVTDGKIVPFRNRKNG